MANKSSAGKVAAGLGVAAVAAAAAAAYYFTGPEGKKHKNQAKAWGKTAKAEMVQKIKKMEKFSKQAYHEAAKEVLAKYKQAKNVKPEELAAFGKELTGYWEKISKEAVKLGAAKKPVTKAKKAKK